MTAYTVGNPESYDPAIEAGPVSKAPKGVVFARLAEAESVLKNGRLPVAWSLGHLPGAVYELELDGPLEDVSVEDRTYLGGRRLIREQKIVRKIEREAA